MGHWPLDFNSRVVNGSVPVQVHGGPGTRFSKIEVICRVLGSRVRTKVEPDLDPFTYRGLNKDPDPGRNLRVIGESGTHLHPYLTAMNNKETRIIGLTRVTAQIGITILTWVLPTTEQLGSCKHSHISICF